MQYFQTILISIGLLAIVGVLIHGFLVNKRATEELGEVDTDMQPNADSIEDKTQNIKEKIAEKLNIKMNKTVERSAEPMVFDSVSPEKKEDLDSFMFDMNTQDIPDADEPFILLSGTEEEDEAVNATFESSDAIEEQPADADISLSNDVSLTDNMTAEEEIESEASTPVSRPVNDVAETKQPDDIFIFNVAAKNGEDLGGHQLLQFFLTSGFRYGEMGIFHRHEHSDGTGDVLFSIANMMAPGTFDLDTMEQFTSEGISFFFTVPNQNVNAKKAFDMMLRAVEQIAEEFNCEVLNQHREAFTEQQFVEYQDRLHQYI